MVVIKGRALTTHKVIAVTEHFIGLSQSISIQAPDRIDGSQVLTITEHIIHAFHIVRVEAAQVDVLKAIAVSAHLIHPFHFLGVKVAKVDTFQFIAIKEHRTHIGHLAGVQILNAFNGFKM